MGQHYSNPRRADDPHALPDIETFKGYRHECRECDAETPLFPDYYGLIHLESEECRECGARGTLRCVDTKAAWYWWTCLPGCVPDSEPVGPFETEEVALADAREGIEDEDDGGAA